MSNVKSVTAVVNDPALHAAVAFLKDDIAELKSVAEAIKAKLDTDEPTEPVRRPSYFPRGYFG